MHCETTQNAIDNCPYGSETLTLSAACQAHLSQCPRCQQYAEDRALSNILTHISQTSVPDHWEAKVLDAARARNRANRSNPVWHYSVAASIIFALLLTVFTMSKAPAPEITKVQLTVDQVSAVKFMLSSNHALSGANIHVALSDNIELAGFNGARQLNWKTDIKQGNNLLTLPVHLLQPVDGKIELLLEHEGSTKSYVINVSPSNNSAINDQAAESI